MADRSLRVVLTLDAGQYKTTLQQASRDTAALGTQGQRSGFQIRNAMQVAAGSVATVGIAKLVKDSVQLEAAYSRTMRQVAQQTKAPKAAMAELDDLAMKLGADTVFSAQESASAMLELAKGGLSPAQIQAGALKNSLTLAAAGSLDLDVAANSVVNTMGAFRLEASQTDEAVSALAGAANASSADVSDITQALAQAGTEANSAGLSVQETTGILAAFSNAGIQGSDAGTTLRTMLTRLVPQTKEQAQAMAELGLTFTDSNGEFVSATQIAERLQRTFGGMSAKERTAALTTIFGADARRAANILIQEGADGLEGYIRQTSDLGAAQRLADASMSGTSGALENLSGQIETAKIQFGKGLAPAIVEVADRLSDVAGSGDLEAFGRDAGEAVVELLDELAPLAASLRDLSGSALPALATAGSTVVDVLELAADVVTPFVDAFNQLPESAQQALILAGGAQVLGRRLGVLPGISEAAGGGLLTFGGNARSAGNDAKGSVSKIDGLVGSLKGFAGITIGIVALQGASNELDNLNRFLSQARDSSDELSKTFTDDGKSTAGTVDALMKAFSDGRIGKNAGALGIDLDKLAASLKKSGSQGEYVQEVLAGLDEKYSRASSVFSDLPFVETQSGRIDEFRSALRDLTDELDTASEKAVERAEQQRLSANAWLISAAGLDEYKTELMGLPTEVITRILTPGALDSAADVEALVRKYELTPDLVRTIISLSGADFSAEQMRDILGLADRIDRRKARATVNALTRSAEDGLKRVIGLLAGVRSKSVSVTVEQNIRRSYSDQAPSSNSLADMLTDPAGRWMGGRVPAGYASGGVVPGRPPSNPMLDNVIARGPAGKTLMVRSGEWIINERSSRENDQWLAAINAGLNLSDLLGDVPGFASGGQVDAVSSLELTRLRIRMRDLQRSLNEREKYGKKPKGKDTRPTRYVLRGLDRVEARQDLIETRREYAGTLRASRDARRRGMSPDEYNEYRDNRAEQRRQLREDRRQATESFISSNTSIEGLSTPEQVERALDRSIADMATLTSLLFQLKKRGAAPWLLQQLQAAGPSKSAIKLARHYLSDANALRRVNAQVATLQGVAGAYGQLTTDPAWMAARGWSGNLSAAQRQQVTKLEQTVTMKFDETSLAREVARLVQHNLDAGQQKVGVLG
jgi:TP901 family phage tail tape measure protein